MSTVGMPVHDDHIFYSLNKSMMDENPDFVNIEVWGRLRTSLRIPRVRNQFLDVLDIKYALTRNPRR